MNQRECGFFEKPKASELLHCIVESERHFVAKTLPKAAGVKPQEGYIERAYGIGAHEASLASTDASRLLPVFNTWFSLCSSPVRRAAPEEVKW